MNDFEGSVALVTGAASGIGRAIARLLVARGASVVGADIAERGLDELAVELGDRFRPVVTDVTAEDRVAAAVAAADAAFGALTAAFNVAGGTRPGAIVDLSEQDGDFSIDLVQKGVFLCTKHEARAMTARGTGGAIVNVASLNAHVPMPSGSGYATAKAAVEMFSKNAALELATAGIRVNAVLPGLVDTPMTAPLLAHSELAADFMQRIPLRRAAHPDEIARVCLFLATAEASYVTGASVVVDGGWELSNYPAINRFF